MNINLRKNKNKKRNTRIFAVIRANIQQLLLVFVAFFVMAAAGCLSIMKVIKTDRRQAVTDALNNAEKAVKLYLLETSVLFENIHTTTQHMLDIGAPSEELTRYLVSASKTLRENGGEDTPATLGFYAYMDGELIDSLDLRLPDGLVPEERLWYTEAMAAEDYVYTKPYFNTRAWSWVTTLTKKLSRDGVYCGVLALDIEFDWLMDCSQISRHTLVGYSIILNEDFDVLAYEHPFYIGQKLGIIPGYDGVAQKLSQGEVVFGDPILDYNGANSLIFFSKMFNGLYLGIVSPLSAHYGALYGTAAVLVALATALFALLSYMLLRLNMDKFQSQEESRTKSSFLARMSHEIRTPMNAIIGMSELAMRAENTAAMTDHIAVIKHAAYNLLSIINDILDFSKIESGNLQLMPAHYSLSSVINDVISIARVNIMEKPIDFVVFADSNIPNSMYGDEARIRQVVLNLLSNAAKYTEKGRIEFTLQGEFTGAEGIMLTFSVTDTGIGIKPEDLDTLFNEFVRLESSNSHVTGTGLGLVIARSLCRAMGGDISVASEYGKGSTFTAKIHQIYKRRNKLANIRSPIGKNSLVYEERELYAQSLAATFVNLGVYARVASDRGEFFKELATDNYAFAFVMSKAAQDTLKFIRDNGLNTKLAVMSGVGESSSFSGAPVLILPLYVVPVANVLNGATFTNYKSNVRVRFTAPEAYILVVDDIETNLKVVEGLLAPYMARVDTCMSGARAIELVQQNKYDIIFMDHMMPGMDGVEATEVIHKSGFKMPIVALTANAMQGMREMFISKGFDDHLAKPIEITKLNEMVEKWIPREKRVKAEAAERETDTLDFKLDGVDTARGLALSGGSRDAYVDMLKLYCRDAGERMDILSQPPEGDLLLFTTHVHALKGASANIGALEVSEKAALLEEAGRRGDREKIKEHLSSFRGMLVTLMACIREVTQESGQVPKAPQNFRPRDGDGGALADILSLAKAALSTQNIREFDNIMEKLKRGVRGEYDQQLLSDITDCVLMFEYDAAIEKINMLQGAGSANSETNTGQ
ncbi:MAG: response regulator [Clostridiales bacterium]|jgi:signal transduction histidine kinase/DNA-binding response OmpR family regulator|nr:response regulator [Clostridiales bacterium]